MTACDLFGRLQHCPVDPQQHCGLSPIPSIPLESSAVRVIARLLWILPAILLFLSINQAFVAHDIRETLVEGEPATAQVIEFDRSDRSEVTYAYVSLRVELPDGRTITKEQMSLPYSLLPFVEGRNELDVIVRPGADQEIVIAEVGKSHWRLAAVNAAMSFAGFILFGVGIFFWNRMLARQGDPGDHVGEPRDMPPAEIA